MKCEMPHFFLVPIDNVTRISCLSANPKWPDMIETCIFKNNVIDHDSIIVHDSLEDASSAPHQRSLLTCDTSVFITAAHGSNSPPNPLLSSPGTL